MILQLGRSDPCKPVGKIARKTSVEQQLLISSQVYTLRDTWQASALSTKGSSKISLQHSFLVMTQVSQLLPIQTEFIFIVEALQNQVALRKRLVLFGAQTMALRLCSWEADDVSKRTTTWCENFGSGHEGTFGTRQHCTVSQNMRHCYQVWSNRPCKKLWAEFSLYFQNQLLAKLPLFQGWMREQKREMLTLTHTHSYTHIQRITEA